ncbi:MAG TPA: flagellin [Caulobacterales bacterium]|nr:flagellin [Caulobacterales bacterium]
MTSVNTNYGALVALQSLNATTKQLAEVQNHVNTGLKVASAKDNGAVFAIAEGQRARVASLGAVQDGIDRATSVIDVGLSAGEAIGDILKQLKEKSVAAQATDLSQDQRDALQADFKALRDQIDQIANAATFNGSNLVNGSNLTGGANAFTVLTTDASGSGSSAYSKAAGAIGGGTLYSASQDLATATGLTFAAGDAVQFSITQSGVTTSYTVGVAGTDTIQDFLDAVNTGTNGQVTASYDDTTGVITYNSSVQFDVQFVDNAGAGKTDGAGGMFDGGATTTGSTFTAGGGGGGSNSVSVDGFDFRLGKAGQALATVTSTLDISTATGASAASTAIDTAITELNKNLATLGAQSKALDVQKTFLGKLSDTITAGIGNLVDADLAKESAMLQSLQVKQQLGAQALSIANQAPSIVLSFFR